MLLIDDNHVNRILGSPDDLKLKSSMTLFSQIEGADPVFANVLAKFFNGIKDWETLKILEAR